MTEKDHGNREVGPWDLLTDVGREVIQGTGLRNRRWMTLWLIVFVGLAVLFAVTHVAGWAWVTPPLVLVTAALIGPPGSEKTTATKPAPSADGGASKEPLKESA